MQDWYTLSILILLDETSTHCDRKGLYVLDGLCQHQNEARFLFLTVLILVLSLFWFQVSRLHVCVLRGFLFRSAAGMHKQRCCNGTVYRYRTGAFTGLLFWLRVGFGVEL